MLPSGCGMPAMPMKLSFLMSASEAFSSAETRASSASFTLSMVPSRALQRQYAAIDLLDLTADSARLLRIGGRRKHQRKSRSSKSPPRHI